MNSKDVNLLKKLTDEPQTVTESEKEYIVNSNYKFLIAKAMVNSKYFTENQIDILRDKIVNYLDIKLSYKVIKDEFTMFDDIDFVLFLDRAIEEDAKIALSFIKFLKLLKKDELYYGKLEMAVYNYNNPKEPKIFEYKKH